MIFGDLTSFKSVEGAIDRKQRIVFVGAILGFFCNNILMVLYLWGGKSDALLWATNVTYNLTFITIATAAYRNFHFMRFAVVGMLLVYAQIWARTFVDATLGLESFVNIPVLFFCPIAMAVVSSYRLMTLVAFTQPVLLFIHARFYGKGSYASGWTDDQLFQYSSAIALVSFVSCLLLAAIAYLREQTDRRLLSMIAEKDMLAAEDSLTGLKNRRSFLNTIARKVTEHRRFACVFIDLDRFKPLNDEYGHRVGDKVLRTIGKRLGKSISVTESARFGGDEFAVLIDLSAKVNVLQSALQELHQAISADINTEAGIIGVGASLGYSVFPDDAHKQSDLMHCADTAMRRAKVERLKIARFDKAADTSSLSSAALEIALHDALKRDQIRPALQPIACAKTGRILGFEILARWVDSGFARDPLPIDFIPLAEKSGLLNEVMLSTLEQALRSEPLTDGQFLAVNISPSQLTGPEFLSEIEVLLRKHDVSPAQVELEITEQVAFRNLERNLQLLDLARKKGFKISLDDFGVGYSSLSMLDSLPLNKIKIDRSFVQRSDKQSANYEILEATITLIKKLGLTCCIEGIEDHETLEHVTHLGCDQLQGFLIGKPTLAEQSHSDVVVSLKEAYRARSAWHAARPSRVG